MKRKVSHVRIEPAANGGHIVHTQYEGMATQAMLHGDKPHAFANLNDTMKHVHGVLSGNEEKGETGPDPDDKKQPKHSWQS